MGCHTWCLKPVEDVSYEEAKIHLIKKLSAEIHNCQYWIDNPTCEDYLSIIEDYEDWTIEYLQNIVDICTRQLRMVEAGLCKEAVMHKYRHGDKLTVYTNGQLYVNTDFGNMFRKYGYPHDKLFSLQETLDYINNPDNECVTYDWTIEKINEFWNEHPNGMIQFG